MRIVSFKGSRIKIFSPRDVKLVLCVDRKINWDELMSMDDNEVFGREPITVKFPEECLKEIDLIAKQYNVYRSELIRKAYVYGRKKKWI